MPRKKQDNSGAETKPRVLSPFDIIKMMFSDYNSFSKLKDDVLQKNYYIINERMSIQFPMQAAAFNDMKINMAEVIRCWADFLRKAGYKSVPSFVYVKGKKKAEESQLRKAVKKFPDKLLKEYSEKFNYSIKDVKESLKLFPQQTEKDLEEFDKLQKKIAEIKEGNVSDYVIKKK